jgi:hypothetical protein
VPGAATAGEGAGPSTESTAGFALGLGPSGSAGSGSGEEASRRRLVYGGKIGAKAAPPGASAAPVQASSSSPMPSEERDPGSLPAKTTARSHRTAWADLLQRVFEVDALRCPQCGARMRIMSAITEPAVARRILAWLDRPSRAPPHGSATEGSRSSGAESAPELAWDEDPGFDFDQSLPVEE